MSDVGEDSNVEFAPIEPVLRKSLACCLNNGCLCPMCHHACQELLNDVRSRGGRVQAGIQFLLCHLRASGCDQAGAETAGAQDVVQKGYGGCFPVGAGYPNEEEPAGRKAIPGSKQPCPGLPSVLDKDSGRPGKERDRPFADDCGRAACCSLGSVIVPIVLDASVADKERTRLNSPRIRRDASDESVFRR